MKLKEELKLGLLIILAAILFNPFSLRIMYETFFDYIYDKKVQSEYDYDLGITSDGEIVEDNNIKSYGRSDLTGENYNFDITYYPYFAMLNESEKKLYKQIYANANELVDTFEPFVDVNVSEVKNTFEAVYNDHPELFWLNTSYSYKYTASNKCVQIVLNFNETADDINKHKEIFYTATNKIIKDANKLKTDYEKEKYVHDLIVKNVKYDKNASMNQSAYSAIINKKTICAGYSRAFQYIMIQLHIPTYYCVGVSSVNHAWNIVKLDGGYYNVDLTWDNSDITRYKYFNKTDKDFSTSHKRTGLSLNLPKCNSTKYRNYSVKSQQTSQVNSNVKSNVTSNAISNEVKSNITSSTNSNIVIINDNERKNSNSNIDVSSNITSNVISNINSNSNNSNESDDKKVINSNRPPKRNSNLNINGENMEEENGS